jgi:hypothetical protein
MTTAEDRRSDARADLSHLPDGPATGSRAGAVRSSRSITGFGMPLAVAGVGQRGCCNVVDLGRVADSIKRLTAPDSRRTGCPMGFGSGRGLRHTVQVVLSRVRLPQGAFRERHPTSATPAHPVPTSQAGFSTSRGCVRVTHPTAGAGGPGQVNSGGGSQRP